MSTRAVLPLLAVLVIGAGLVAVSAVLASGRSVPALGERLPSPSVDVDIYYGQNGPKIDDNKEDNPGTYTEVNWQGEEEAANLMEVVIESAEGGSDTTQVTLTRSSGDAVIWLNAERTGTSSTYYQTTKGALPKSVYMECPTASASVYTASFMGATDSVKGTGIDVEIKGTPDKVYFSAIYEAMAHVPVCFKIVGLDLARGEQGYEWAESDPLSLEFEAESESSTLDVETTEDFDDLVHEGNYYDGTNHGSNTYTVFPWSNLYLINLDDDVTVDTGYYVTANLTFADGGDHVLNLVSDEYPDPDGEETITFADQNVESVCLGDGILTRPTHTDTRQDGVQKDGDEVYTHCEQGYCPPCDDEPFPHQDAHPFGFEVYEASCTALTDASYRTLAELYDPANNGVFYYTIFRAGRYNVQRGVYFGIYYGLKTPAGLGMDVVDISKNTGYLEIDGFTAATFYGKITSAYVEDETDWPAVGLALLGTTGVFMGPLGWGTLFTIACCGTGLALAIDWDDQWPMEQAFIHTYQAVVVNSLEDEGDPSRDHQWDDHEFTCEGTDDEYWPFSVVRIQTSNEHAVAGDLFYVYLRSVTVVQAKSGYIGSVYIEAETEFDTNEDDRFWIDTYAD